MRFLLDDEQRAFAHSLDALLTAADTPSVVRSWGAGDHTAGRALWSRIADAGVFALAVPEAYEGSARSPSNWRSPSWSWDGTRYRARSWRRWRRRRC